MKPACPSPIEGVRLRLRLVTPDDAAYIHGLRTDPRYNAHLSAVTGTIADQRAWIERYKTRETAGSEYYFVIERLSDSQPCGVVRLYDVTKDRFTWGSWILDENKPAKAALESAVLSFDVAFDRLGLQVADIDVRRENSRALHFYQRFGMKQTGEDAQNIYFEYPRARLQADLPAHSAAINAANKP